MSLRPVPVIVTLGDKSWSVRPFTILELQTVEPIVQAAPLKGGVETALALIVEAIKRDTPDDVVSLGSLATTWPELNEAARQVLVMAGYLMAEPKPGESQAAESAAALTSGSSTGA